MTLYRHEMKRAKIALIAWSAVLGFMLGLTVLIYPQMAQQMDEVTKAFSEMGAFSSAFGMDRLNFGELTDYFVVECGNVLGLGGAVFAAIAGAAALAKEEREHTAEFLCAHPVSRTRIAVSKLAAVGTQIVILNAAVAAVTALCIAVIGERADAGVIALSFLAYLILQFEIAAIGFAVSAFAVRGSMGIGIGVAFGLYFFNILSNITEDVEFLKYITPFALADGAEIKEAGHLSGPYLAVTLVVTVVAAVIGVLYFRQKDL